MQLKVEIEQLQKENQSLGEQLSVMEQKVSQGDFNPATTKVFSYHLQSFSFGFI